VPTTAFDVALAVKPASVATVALRPGSPPSALNLSSAALRLDIAEVIEPNAEICALVVDSSAFRRSSAGLRSAATRPETMLST
jgi:hypothetical protein